MMTDTPAYSHRNGEAEPPTESGCYQFIGRVQGVINIASWPVFFLLDGEDGPSHADLKRRCVGKWWGPMTPPWTIDTEDTRGTREP